jgi:hypothetical protein
MGVSMRENGSAQCRRYGPQDDAYHPGIRTYLGKIYQKHIKSGKIFENIAKE